MKIKITPKTKVATAADDASATRNRESYLLAAIDILAPLFEEVNHKLPPVRVSVGWPGGRGGGKALGSCWKKEASKDKTFQIFISPVIDDTIRALDILVHELCHAATNCSGHDAAFAQLVHAVGLDGKPSATFAGPGLIERLNADVVGRLGTYPHAALNPEKSGQKKQGTRLIKCVCPSTGYTVRTTRAWISQYGAPLSPATKQPMKYELPAEAEDDSGAEDAA